MRPDAEMLIRKAAHEQVDGIMDEKMAECIAALQRGYVPLVSLMPTWHEDVEARAIAMYPGLILEKEDEH